MKNTIGYEWDYETLEDNDVIDHNHADKLSWFNPSDVTDSLVLIRDEGNENEGLVNRYWAYVVNGKLPMFFSSAVEVTNIAVPACFHAELSKYLSIPAR